MSKISIHHFCSGIIDLITSFTSAVIFYTVLPLPTEWTSNWSRIARWCPVIGLFIGLLLTILGTLLELSGMPNLTLNTVIVIAWIALTGGLHLDGAMDTADGLSVTNPQRRLEVMKDSNTGAFGAIAAIVIVLLKIVSLSEISLPLCLVLPSAAGWARWGQVWAIAFYPYLRETGKGAFHQKNLRSPQDILLGLGILLCFSSLWFTVDKLSWWQGGLIVMINLVISLLTGYWINRQLGGHTGDTYGAVVEWSEAFILCLLTLF
ncbi:MAG: adenosylcobinamide-GDP ribazoletransferase [Cyanobacteria bacterium P01_E01_bin.35]